ncbi:MAG: hypothetical protein ABI914_07505 [Acidobacteriota bacterium]
MTEERNKSDQPIKQDETPEPKGELSDEALEGVAGGTGPATSKHKTADKAAAAIDAYIRS